MSFTTHQIERLSTKVDARLSGTPGLPHSFFYKLNHGSGPNFASCIGENAYELTLAGERVVMENLRLTPIFSYHSVGELWVRMHIPGPRVLSNDDKYYATWSEAIHAAVIAYLGGD